MFQVILDHHTKPEEAGTIFTRTRPKLAVYHHFVLLGTREVPPLKEAEVLEMTRKTYSGPLAIGEDLMRFDLTAEGVKIVAPAP